MKVGSGAAAVELKEGERMKEEEMVDSLSLTPYTFQAINVVCNESRVQLYSLYFNLVYVGFFIYFFF